VDGYQPNSKFKGNKFLLNQILLTHIQSKAMQNQIFGLFKLTWLDEHPVAVPTGYGVIRGYNFGSATVFGTVMAVGG